MTEFRIQSPTYLRSDHLIVDQGWLSFGSDLKEKDRGPFPDDLTFVQFNPILLKLEIRSLDLKA